MENKSLKVIFKDDLNRMQKFVKEIKVGEETIRIDYAKTHLIEPDIARYRHALDQIELNEKIKDMFEGKKINFTEDRKVLHVALRDAKILEKLETKDEGIVLSDEYKDCYDELVKMKELSTVLTAKKLLGANGKVINTIVNIGIGGSDLGPRMVCKALEFYKCEGLNVHFVSNVDSTEIYSVFKKIDPNRTLFVVVSKTFTTQETLENATLAKELCIHKMKLDEKVVAKHHFMAISSNKEEVNKFGIETIFSMGDYVGGRYSLWSPAGISICLYIGFNNFLKMLKGASIMDQHFKTTEVPENIPVMHAICELYYNNDLDYNNKCVLAYDQYLEKLPSYLQQAEMESNGKTATKNGKSEKTTGMIIWGEIGTNSQHSFFQLIHQGTRNILCEFLVALNPIKNGCPRRDKHHNILYANCVAQSEALMIGKEDKNLNKNFPGDKPSITITFTKLTPMVLGSLIALYEHKIFVQGIFWGINSYDQFGVELGKKLAKTIVGKLNDGGSKNEHDPSTNALIDLKIIHKN